MSRSLLAALLVLALPVAVHAQEPRIFLSWGTPSDSAISSTVSWTAGDTSRVDTLCFSFDPGRDTTLVGATAVVSFRAVSGDSLVSFWRSAGGVNPPHGMKFEFANVAGAGYPFPFESFGIGDFGYTRPGRTIGELRFIFAVAASRAARVRGGKRYGLGRVLVRRPPAGTPMCDQAICVEWADATLAYAPGKEPHVNTGITYAGINTTAGERGCGVPNPVSAAGTGKPKGKKGKKSSP